MTRHCFRQVFLAASLGVLAAGCGHDSIERNRSAVRVNEVSPNNKVYQDVFGNAADWIELYNTRDTVFDLEDCYISDSAKKRFKDQFPAGYTIAAHGVLLVIADGDPLASNELEPHMSFKLSNTGEGVWLSNPAGYLIDSVQFSLVPPNDAGTKETSFARFPDGTGEFEWCSASTFNKLNGERCGGEEL